MPKLKKRAGQEEEYDRNKLEKSMKNAGAKEETVRKVLETFKHQEGMTTQQVRNHVINELKKHEPEVANRYETYVKPVK
ncbi:MAG: ATP cone domain-containing protein [candidate division WOR-3 bacterium]|nr:ATP cone domain-containing protein [candidate division WOR-3 bacterium]